MTAMGRQLQAICQICCDLGATGDSCFRGNYVQSNPLRDGCNLHVERNPAECRCLARVRTGGHEFSLWFVGLCWIVSNSVDGGRGRLFGSLDAAGWIPAFAGMTWESVGMTGDGLGHGATRAAVCVFRAWGCLLWGMVSRSGHGSRIVREFCFVKYDALGGVRVGRGRLDSRLRGNDVDRGGMTWEGLLIED